MKYGLPYKGSKNKLAERIVSLMPKADHLIDLFCGGCAVSHCAMLRDKWPHIHINDIDWRPVTLFVDALDGQYCDETRWISREDFFRLKDTDPYVAIVWSFGNNMRDYLYSQEIEPLKRAIHFAMFYGDYEPARELGHDLSFIEPLRDLQKRYIAVKHYFSRLGHFQQQSFEGGRIGVLAWSQPRDSAGVVESGGGGFASYPVKRPYEMQHLECQNRVGQFKKKKKEPERLQSHEQRRDLLQIAVPRTAPLATRCGGGGRNRYSLTVSATISRSKYPTVRSSTATYPILTPTYMTRSTDSTTSVSTTGAAVRRSRCSSAATTCPTTASAASRNLRIAALCRPRPTISSPSASTSLGIRHRRRALCS